MGWKLSVRLESVVAKKLFHALSKGAAYSCENSGRIDGLQQNGYKALCLFSRRGLATKAHKQDDSTAENICVEISVPYKLHGLPEGPSQQAYTNKEELIHMYQEMSTIRRMEITADLLFKSQQIRGFCHLYDGQEAVAVGLQAALTSEDSIISAYRDHGIYLARGGSVFVSLFWANLSQII